MNDLALSAVLATPDVQRARPGDYFHSETDLYRVEQVRGNRVVVEDCRTELEIEMDLSELMKLERVRPRGDGGSR
jgi:Lhr-like helicase